MAYNVQGTGKFQISHKDLSRDHRCTGKTVSHDERARIAKTSMQIYNDRIISKVVKDEYNEYAIYIFKFSLFIEP